MGFNEKLRDTLGKSFLELIDGMLPGKQKEDRFLRFQQAYSTLEMFNITKETAGGKTKKFNLWSLNNDAAHCYFGSLCDFLITDDKGLQVKAQIMYNLFGVPTRILSTKDFVELNDTLFHTEKTIEAFIDKLVYNLSNSNAFSMESVIETREVIICYELAKPHFGIFDIMEYIEYPNGSRRCILTLLRDAPEITLMGREIELTSKKIFRVFGQDRDGKGDFRSDEPPTIGRFRWWIIAGMVLQLALEQEDNAFYLKLYVDIHQNTHSDQESNKRE